jgi:hypothetical protein
MDYMKHDDILYYAGFFDGEGSASLTNVKDRHGKIRKRLTASVAQVDRSVLDYLVAEMGCGNVLSKGDKKAMALGRPECFSAVFTHRAAREFLVTIEPYLKVKSDHVTGLLDITGRDIEKASTNGL